MQHGGCSNGGRRASSDSVTPSSGRGCLPPFLDSCRRPGSRGGSPPRSLCAVVGCVLASLICLLWAPGLSSRLTTPLSVPGSGSPAAAPLLLRHFGESV